VTRQRQVERDLARMLASLNEPGRPGNFTVPELRDLVVEYLNDFDDELARHPQLAASGHWNQWMDDTDLNDALFAVVIVRPSGLEFFCGRGRARAIRDFFDNWIGDVDALLPAARKRKQLTIPDRVVCVGRRAVENWLHRSLGLKAEPSAAADGGA
jgi:hypothetical protein